jgi:hypothetical protein
MMEVKGGIKKWKNGESDFAGVWELLAKEFAWKMKS